MLNRDFSLNIVEKRSSTGKFFKTQLAQRSTEHYRTAKHSTLLTLKLLFLIVVVVVVIIIKIIILIVVSVVASATLF